MKRLDTVSSYAQRTGLSEDQVYERIHKKSLEAYKHRAYGSGQPYWIIITEVPDAPLKEAGS